MARPKKIRRGPRPDTWKSGPDPFTHEQYVAWLKHKSQAKFRGEPHQLTFDDWQWAWLHQWHKRGRNKTSLMLVRVDWHKPWQRDNVMLVTRKEFHYRQLQMKIENGTIKHIRMDQP